jgi:hypothetical protein
MNQAQRAYSDHPTHPCVRCYRSPVPLADARSLCGRGLSFYSSRRGERGLPLQHACGRASAGEGATTALLDGPDSFMTSTGRTPNCSLPYPPTLDAFTTREGSKMDSTAGSAINKSQPTHTTRLHDRPRAAGSAPRDNGRRPPETAGQAGPAEGAARSRSCDHRHLFC